MDSSPPPIVDNYYSSGNNYFADLIGAALFALAGLGGTVWLILGVGWSWHLVWLLLLLPYDLLGLLLLQDLTFERTELIWTVTGKSVRAETDDNGVTHYCYSLQAEHRRFSVDERIYNSVSEGEEVVVTFKRRSYVIATVRKLGAETTPADIEA